MLTELTSDSLSRIIKFIHVWLETNLFHSVCVLNSLWMTLWNMMRDLNQHNFWLVAQLHKGKLTHCKLKFSFLYNNIYILIYYKWIQIKICYYKYAIFFHPYINFKNYGLICFSPQLNYWNLQNLLSVLSVLTLRKREIKGTKQQQQPEWEERNLSKVHNVRKDRWFLRQRQRCNGKRKLSKE